MFAALIGIIVVCIIAGIIYVYSSMASQPIPANSPGIGSATSLASTSNPDMGPIVSTSTTTTPAPTNMPAPTSTNTPNTPEIPVADPILLNPLRGQNISDEGSNFALVDKAWRGLTTYDKISMGLPANMQDPSYHIAYDPTLQFYSALPSMTQAGCQLLCDWSKGNNCAAPIFLSRAQNICYGKLK